MDFESLDLPGAPFRIAETYVYYEGPKTLALRSISMPDLYYFVMTVDEEDDGTIVALAAAASGDRFRAVRSGLVTFRQAFTEASHRALHMILWRWPDEADRPRIQVDEIHPSQIDDRWLPTVGARLELPTETAKAFDPFELLTLSQAQNRSVFALEVDPANTLRTELPVRASGELQLFLGGGIEGTMAKRWQRSRQKTSRQVRPLAIGTRAASYVFLMAMDSGTDGAMIEPTEITGSTLDDWNALVAAVGADDTTALLRMLGGLPSPVRNNFRRLLGVLRSLDSGVRLAAAVAFTQEVRQASATAEQVRTAVAAIEEAPPVITYATVNRGVFTGHVMKTRRFDLIDLASGEAYRGHMDAEAAAEANGLPVGDTSFVSARVRIETPFASEEGASGTVYALETISRRDATGPAV